MKNPIGRPRKTVETQIKAGIVPKKWKEEVLQMGREGKALIHIINYFQIDWDLFEKWRERDKDFAETVNMYQQFSEQWWIDVAQNLWINNESKRINSNHWSLVMRNMFKARWSEKKEVDITTKGNELGANSKIEIEIIKNTIKEEEDGDTKDNG